jgi:hypothetical protein
METGIERDNPELMILSLKSPVCKAHKGGLWNLFFSYLLLTLVQNKSYISVVLVVL